MQKTRTTGTVPGKTRYALWGVWDPPIAGTAGKDMPTWNWRVWPRVGTGALPVELGTDVRSVGGCPPSNDRCPYKKGEIPEDRVCADSGRGWGDVATSRETPRMAAASGAWRGAWHGPFPVPGASRQNRSGSQTPSRQDRERMPSALVHHSCPGKLPQTPARPHLHPCSNALLPAQPVPCTHTPLHPPAFRVPAAPGMPTSPPRVTARVPPAMVCGRPHPDRRNWQVGPLGGTAAP